VVGNVAMKSTGGHQHPAKSGHARDRFDVFHGREHTGEATEQGKLTSAP
jgi:hypothetical protein